MLSPRANGVLAVVLTIVFWASAYPGIRVGLRAFSPGELAAVRFLVASVVFGVFAAVGKVTLPRGADLLRVTIAGAIGIAAYNLLLNSGELTVSAGGASFLINCMPVFAALMAVIFLGERLRALGWLGIAVSFLGITAISLGESGGMRFGRGAVLVLGAALCAAVQVTIQKPLMARHSAISVTACLMWSGALLLAPFLPHAWHVIHAGESPAVRSSLGAAVYLGIFPAALAYGFWAVALTRFPLSQAASMLYLISPVAILISFVWLREIPAPLSIIGGAIAITGVVILARSARQTRDGGEVQRAVTTNR